MATSIPKYIVLKAFTHFSTYVEGDELDNVKEKLSDASILSLMKRGFLDVDGDEKQKKSTMEALEASGDKPYNGPDVKSKAPKDDDSVYEKSGKEAEPKDESEDAPDEDSDLVALRAEYEEKTGKKLSNRYKNDVEWMEKEINAVT